MIQRIGVCQFLDSAVNILAVARQGKPIRDRIGHIRFQAGDVVLIQGAEQLLYESLNSLGCLPLASREISVPGQSSYLPLVIFTAAIAAAVFGLVRIDVAFIAAGVVSLLAMPMYRRFDRDKEPAPR